MEHSEHLICILGLREFCLEDGCNLRLNVVNLLIVSPLGAVPVLAALFSHIKDIETVKELVGVIDLSQSDIF